VRALRACPLFRDLGADVLEELGDSAEWVGLEADAALFHEGDPGDALYMLVEGRLEAWWASPDGEAPVGRIYPGDPVGETALLGDRPRTATVRAVRDSVLVRVSREALERVATRSPKVLFGLCRVLIERANDPGPVSPPPRVFAVVSATPFAPVDRLAESLVSALGQHGPSHRVDSARVDDELGPGAAQAALGDPGHARGAAWLSALESEDGQVVLVADREESEWTRRCIRLADVILLVADAREAPGRQPLPARLAGSPEGRFDRRELVLVHPDESRSPSGASRWLDAVAVQGWHHVRLGARDDVARLARFVRGRAVALALAGGGARGYAHLGVLRALREARVPVDLVCGTSIGAIVSALYAMGHDDEQIVDEIRRGFVDRSPIDYGIPLLSLARGRRFDGILERAFGDRRAEDTWRRWFCVSCSLSRRAAVAHHRGPLTQAVRASCALPGVLPPAVVDGDVHVDGVFLDNLPAELAAREAGGPVIAVNVLPPSGSAAWEGFTKGSGLLAHAARMLDPGAAGRLPPILQVGLEGIFLGTMQASERIRKSADVFIEPPVGDVWFLDFAKFEPVIRAGYDTARRELARWTDRREGN
jgi:predicted acylesterase/phospholipase RssA